MKILFLTRRAWPEIGGVEKHVLEVSRQLVEMGNEVTVIAEEDGGLDSRFRGNDKKGGNDRRILNQVQDDRKTREWPLERVKIYRIPVTGNEKLKKFWIWGWLFKNRKLIEEADLVHAHDVGFWYWPFRFLYPRKPFFITFHGWEEKFPVPLSHKIQRKISEKMAKGNICVGDYLKKWYGTKADEITYGGVDVPPRRSHGFTTDIVFIGRLEKETGITMYLKALRLLRKEKKNFSLTVCGDGPLRKEAEKESRVLGEVGDMEVLGDLREKARFVFTSGYLSILEAMVQKKLVFSVFENPLKEDYLRLGKLGKLVIICGSENELAEKIKFYLKNPAKEKEMTEAAYNWVKEETWEKVTEMYLGVWGF